MKEEIFDKNERLNIKDKTNKRKSKCFKERQKHFTVM